LGGWRQEAVRTTSWAAAAAAKTDIDIDIDRQALHVQL
jgi:hypothetical protein